jgi:hypothetical protein
MLLPALGAVSACRLAITGVSFGNIKGIRNRTAWFRERHTYDLIECGAPRAT